MYPNNINSEKVGKIKKLKAKLKQFKSDFINTFKYIWNNRKQLNKIILIKLHI